MKYIGIGNFSKYHIYILIIILCQFISDFALGLNKMKKGDVPKIFAFTAKLKSHLLIKNALDFFGFLLGGVILYFLSKKLLGKTDNNITMTKIQQKREKYLENKTIHNYINIFIIGFFISFHIIVNSISNTYQIDNHFWMVELISITIFSSIIFNNKIRKHHKLALIIIAPLIILDIISFSLPLTEHTCQTEEACKEKYITDNNLFQIIKKVYGSFCYVVFILFIFSIIIKDYSWIKSKFLMDIRGISSYKILIFIGMVGSILVIICIFISFYIPCNIIDVQSVDFVNNVYIDINNKTYSMSEKVCFIKNFDENEHKLIFYYDNFISFINEYNYKDNFEDKLEIFLIIPIYFIMKLLINISGIMTIKYLDPNYILISRSICYFFEEIIYYFIIIKRDKEYTTFKQFLVQEIKHLISILSNMIYIEFLELKFCNLEYDLKKNIEKRSENERLTKLVNREMSINESLASID